MGVGNVQDAIQAVLTQNRGILMNRGSKGMYQINGKYEGKCSIPKQGMVPFKNMFHASLVEQERLIAKLINLATKIFQRINNSTLRLFRQTKS
jgi:hypothetical protein